MPRQITIKLLKTKDKILKITREKEHIIYSQITIHRIVDFSLETMEAISGTAESVEIKVNPEFCIQQKIDFVN